MSKCDSPYRVHAYLEDTKEFSWADKEHELGSIFKKISRYKKIDKHTRVLEIGIGTGWIQVLCAKKQIPCTGLEVSAELAKAAHEFARSEGVKIDVKVGSVETFPIAESEFDVVIASSVFEHVKDWQAGLRNIFRALKPGGVFFFVSTNKFALKSGEYDFPLYGWLPDKWRYGLRVWRQGPDIMKWGIDWNQFTYFQLRRFFKRLGYSHVYDPFDILDPEALDNPVAWKVTLLRTIKSLPILKYPLLIFMGGTCVICKK